MRRVLKMAAAFSCFLFIHALESNAQLNIASNSIVTENFNSIGSSATASFPANWKLSSAGTGLTSGWATGTNVTATTQAASSGTPSTGGAYNWATSAGTDRAVGFLTTASYTSPNAIMAYYRNATGGSVSSVTVSYALERYVVNTTVLSVDFYYSTNGSTWNLVSGVSTTASDFPAGANSATFTTPKTINKTATIGVSLAANADVYFKWGFTTGNAGSQGVGLDNVSVFAGSATPVLTAKLRDILQVDNGTPNQVNEGDVIRYQTVIKNTGTGDATGVQVTLPTPPANTTMVAGSIKTSALAVDDNYNASFNTALSASTVLANDAGIPLPTAVITYGPSNNVTVSPGTATITDAGGTITLNANGTFTYIPPTGFSGIDKFKYITGNGNLPNNDAVVTITVGADINFTTTNGDPACNNGTNGSITINASGGNGALQYSINGSGGPYQSANSFTGLASGTYNLAVKDAGGYVKTSTTTLNNPAAIVVSGTIASLTYNTAMTPSTFTKTGGTGSITWSASGLPTGLAIDPASGQVTGTPSVTGSFSVTVTATDANGCTGTKSATVSVAPKLSNDSYTAVVGNTQLVTNGHSSPTTPFTADATNILANDASNAAITVTAVMAAPTTAGGTITVDAAGKFTYTPPNGTTGTDSYTYTGTSNGVSATATINFTISNMVWYVNNTYAGTNGAANGSSHRPYTDLTAASTAAQANQIIYVHTGSGNTGGNATLKSAQTLRGAGSTLTVGALTLAAGTKPTLSGTVTLANNVTVDGFDMNTVALTAITNAGTAVTGASVNIGSVTTTTGIGITLTGTGNNVTITLALLTTNGAANAINLTNTAGNVSINGGTLTGGAGAVVSVSGGTVSLTYSGSASQATALQPLVSISGGHATGSVTFNTGTLGATNGTGLQFDNADGAYNFNGTTTLNGGDAGIDILNGSSGTFSFGSNTSISSPSGTAFNSAASSPTVTYSGTVTQNTASQRIINIDGSVSNSITFQTGTITGGASSTGININNANGNVTFSNGLNLGTSVGRMTNQAITITGGTGTYSLGTLNVYTSNAQALVATNADGTINATGTIDASNATAVNIDGPVGLTTLGVTLTSVNSTGGTADGIFLQDCNGSFTITGDGSNTSQGGNASGGIIANKSGADASLATGTGIYLNNVTNVTLRRIKISGTNQNHGIRGTSVTNFVMEYSTVRGNNGTTETTDDIVHGEDAVHFLNLFGTCSFESCKIAGGYSNNVHVKNNTGTLSRLSMNNCLIGDLGDHSANGDRALAFPGGNGDGVNCSADIGITAMNFTLTNSTINYGRGRIAGFINNANGPTQAAVGTMDVVVRGNNMVNSAPTAQQINGGHILEVSGLGHVTYEIACNKMANQNPGTTYGIGVLIYKGHNTAGTPFGNFTGTVYNNTIGLSGIVHSGGGSAATALNFDQQGTGTHTALIKNNIIRRFGEAGIRINNVDNLSSLSTLNATVVGNTTAEPDADAFAGIYLQAGADPSTDNNQVTNFKIGNASLAAEKNNVNDGSAVTLDLYLEKAAGTVNLSRAGSSSSVPDQIAKDCNVTNTSQVYVNSALTPVNTVPTLPPTINEACSPPARIISSGSGNAVGITTTNKK